MFLAKLLVALPVTIFGIWVLWQFYKTYKSHKAYSERLKAREAKPTHSLWVPHIHAKTGLKVCSCIRCGWPEDKIAARPEVQCVPLDIPRCVIEYRPGNDPANHFYCSTHNNVSPNANWCLTAAIDVITSPPKL